MPYNDEILGIIRVLRKVIEQQVLGVGWGCLWQGDGGGLGSG